MSFEGFRSGFASLYQTALPDGRTVRDYLSAGGATGDEAAVVDNILTGGLLELLGFERAAQVYNQQKSENRPDFAPRDPEVGLCFLVEDKATALSLDLNRDNPKSHLRQLQRYARAEGAPLGVLTNGQHWLGWRFEGDAADPILLFNLNALAPDETALRTFFDRFHRTAFTEPLRLEERLAVDEETWRAQARPVGAGQGANQQLLVGELRELIRGLAADAERLLNERLTRFVEYERRVTFLDDVGTERADAALERARQAAVGALAQVQAMLGLVNGERGEVDALLARLEREPTIEDTPATMAEAVLAILSNAQKARGRKPLKSLDDVPNVRDAVLSHAEKALLFHQRRAALANAYRSAIGVGEDYKVWLSLVRETMLGGLSEEERRREFALQAAYVVAIRLLLIRVCEDKGIFRYRFLTDGGLKSWRDNIERYYQFANGNPYDELLEIAYKNAQNLYAHFFTGRELFNWFTLERGGFLSALARLNGFDFADVDADIIGTVYETYLSRKEKKKRGQYYTPKEVVEYLLDGVGYSGTAVIGENKRLLDPACGSGSFLVTAARRLVAAYARLADSDPAAVLERVRASLFGFDLNPFACYLAEVNLLIQLLPLVKRAADVSGGRPPRLERFHIYNVDALARPNRTYFSAQSGITLMAEERDEVERLKNLDSPYEAGFAFVLGNPPYGASLTEDYKALLKQDYEDVFRGKPDTYVFFFRLGVGLLGPGGKLGFITPNTFLMGTNTDRLRAYLLGTCALEEIVDLPQGIWADATVDCVLTVLRREPSDTARRAQPIAAHLLGLKDDLGKLTSRTWAESLSHSQAAWLDAAESGHEFSIRYDALLKKIEDACQVQKSTGPETLRLGDITESSAGVEPYKTSDQGNENAWIKPFQQISGDSEIWKPLLDGTSSVGRYALQWGNERPYIKYGNWLWRSRSEYFFTKTKILYIALRNKSLFRRLIGTIDENGFYNRKNYINIIEVDGSGFDIKYLLCVFNSLLINHWYSRNFDNVNINPDTIRQIPIFPASSDVQAELVARVDRLLAIHKELNARREQGYTIGAKKGQRQIVAPYDLLLETLRTEDPHFPTLTLFDADAAGLATLADGCDASATVSSNAFAPDRHPETVVLRHKALWLEVPNPDLRRFLLGYLARPRWHNQPFADVRHEARLPANPEALARFFAREEAEKQALAALLDEATALDDALDQRILDLYGITDPNDRARVLGSAPPDEDENHESSPAGRGLGGTP